MGFRLRKLFFRSTILLVILELSLQLIGVVYTSLNRRDRDVSKDGEVVILCIGDSFTYGLGVIPEKSYPKQLESELNNHGRARVKIRVVNLGVPGYNSSQCLGQLKNNIHLYRPQIVLVMSGMNNLWNFIDSNYFAIKERGYSSRFNFILMRVDSILTKLKIYKLFKITVVNLEKKALLHLRAQDSFKVPVHSTNSIPRSRELQGFLDNGEKYFGEGKYDLSEGVYRKAMELAPYDFEPHWFMGRFYNFRGEREQAKKEFILALQYAYDPHPVLCILADMRSLDKPKDSEEFQEFANIVKGMRNLWVEKFGEEAVSRMIDPVLLSVKDDWADVLIYDFREMFNLTEAYNAKLIVVTYPYPAGKFQLPDNIYFKISKYLGVLLVDNVSVFNNYLKRPSFDDLFTADGHCNEFGNSIVAKNAADAILRIIK